MSQRVTLAQALEIAVEHHNAGRLPDAEAIYEQILAAMPDNHDALHLLGLIANEKGENERAATLIRKAIAIEPRMPEMHGNLGLVLQDLGRLEEAAAAFETALAGNPVFAEGHNNLGLLLQELGRTDEAMSRFERALEIEPDFAEAHTNLGNARRERGQLSKAEACHRRAIAAAPDFAQAHNNLGSVLQATGRIDEAEACYREALRLDPNYAGAHCNLGSVLQERGRVEEAIGEYRAALAHDPDLAEAHANLGAALVETGEPSEAVESYRRAVALAPETDAFRIGFAACIERVSFEAADENQFDDLLALLDHPAVDPQAITPAVLTALPDDPAFATISTDGGFTETAARLSGVPLLLRALPLSPFMDLGVEATLTELRRAMLYAASAGQFDEAALPFSAALAQHCFLNEYVFSESEEENTTIDTLAVDIAAASDPPPLQIVALAAYRPLLEYDWAETLLSRAWPEAMQAVVTQQVAEPLAERRLRGEIPALTAVEDDTSRAVRTQYEENPYPRWTRFAVQHKPAPIDEVLCGAPLRFALEGYESPDSPDVLIAGCGTGQQVMLAASRYADARILAVDLSLASLSYAMRKTNEAGTGSVEFAQADILGLDGLDQRFDLIECVGVLHHMADPLAGWRMLVDLLKPGAVMKVGLYSEAARRDVVAARALIAECGYDPTPDGIRRCREDIAALAAGGDTAMASIIARPSFYTVSECRDLLFHVQEHRFTLPQVADALQALDLAFLGFEMADQRPMRRFASEYPDARSDLDRWHNFETDNPDTFRGMYQFWVRKR